MFVHSFSNIVDNLYTFLKLLFPHAKVDFLAPLNLEDVYKIQQFLSKLHPYVKHVAPYITWVRISKYLSAPVITLVTSDVDSAIFLDKVIDRLFNVAAYETANNIYISKWIEDHDKTINYLCNKFSGPELLDRLSEYIAQKYTDIIAGVDISDLENAYTYYYIRLGGEE